MISDRTRKNAPTRNSYDTKDLPKVDDKIKIIENTSRKIAPATTRTVTYAEVLKPVKVKPITNQKTVEQMFDTIMNKMNEIANRVSKLEDSRKGAIKKN